MEFRIRYEGQLRAAGNSSTRAPDKDKIRRQLHPQLKELWRVTPALLGMQEPNTIVPEPGQPGTTEHDALRHMHRRCGHEYVPLVNGLKHLTCALDILFLRRDEPGKLISDGGDLDNRLKTLFDGLSMPQNCASVDPTPPDGSGTPLYCLLESDALISGFTVTTDRLLSPTSQEEDSNDVLLLMTVRIKPVSVTLGNIDFSF